VGCQKNDLFSPTAIRNVARYSKGCPRLINVICDNALLIAYASRQSSIPASVIDEVANDLSITSGSRDRETSVNVATLRAEEELNSGQNDSPDNGCSKCARVTDEDTEIVDSRPHITPEESSAENSEPPNNGVCQQSKADVSEPAQSLQSQARGGSSIERTNSSYTNRVRSIRDDQGEVMPAVWPTTVNMVPMEFFDILKGELTRVVGPMSNFLIHERLRSLGASQTTLPRGQLKQFMELMSPEILNDRLKAEFQQRMRKIIESVMFVDGEETTKTEGVTGLRKEKQNV
jgi:hypothetical protein